MLDKNLKDQVRVLFADLVSEYKFRIKIDSVHSERDELIGLLTDVASCSDKISMEVSEGNGLEFDILKDGEPVSILFRMIPNGHEFTTLLLAILNLDGKGKNLPDSVLLARIKALSGEVHIRSFVSLSCTNCPDVVQALNLISMINPKIHHTIIDGAINQDEADRMKIQAVPSVFAGDKLIHVGKAGLADLLGKLEEEVGSAPIQIDSAEKQFDVIVVGGGPAGTSAAIYSARKGLSVALIADRIGGQVLETVGIENVISVPYTTGRQLGNDLKEHMAVYDITLFDNRKVLSATIDKGMKRLTTSLGETLKSEALIIATGASWRRLGIPGESDHIGSGVAFCTHCDGPFYKGKKVAVIGGGNSGLEAAIDLSAIASQVTVLEFAEELKGDKVLQEKLAAMPNVTIHTNKQTRRVIGNDGKVVGLDFTDRVSGSEETLDVDGIFVQIGLSANSDVFKKLVDTNRVGEILVDAHCRTNTPGIYAAGDVSTVPYKQIVVAMGEGAKAALTAFEDRIKGNLIGWMG